MQVSSDLTCITKFALANEVIFTFGLTNTVVLTRVNRAWKLANHSSWIARSQRGQQRGEGRLTRESFDAHANIAQLVVYANLIVRTWIRSARVQIEFARFASVIGQAVALEAFLVRLVQCAFASIAAKLVWTRLGHLLTAFFFKVNGESSWNRLRKQREK